MIEDAYNNMMQAGAMGQTALDNHIMRQHGAAPRAVKPARAAPGPDPNDIASLKMPLSTLKDVWAAKWGDQWVTPSTMVSTEDLPFWRNAFERLRQQELFELFDLSGTVWYRLKE